MKTFRQTITILIIMAAILTIFMALIVPSYVSKANNGTVMTLNDGWYLEDESGARMPFNSFGKEVDLDKVVLVHKHDGGINKVDALGFYNYYSVVEVYVGDDCIYKYGELDNLNGSKLIGNYYSIVDIHRHDMPESEIKLVFYNNGPQTIYSIDGGSGAALETKLIRAYIPSVITPVVCLLFILVSLVLLIKRSTRDLLIDKHVWLMVFAVGISIWELADSQLPMDIGMNAGTICLISFEVFMLLPIPLLMFAHYSCRRYRMLDLVWSVVVIVNFFVLNVLNFLKIADFLRTVAVTLAIVAVSMVIILVQIASEYSRKRSLENSLLLYGYLAFLLSVVIQYLKFFMVPAESNSQIMQVGVLIFLITQISNIFAAINNRINQVTNRLKAQTAFLQETFKSFVPDDRITPALESKANIANTGETRNLTVLESDIRGFSELIQGMTAEDAIAMLNHYLGEMTTILERHDAIVLEFVGDAIIAIFDEEHAGTNHADKAVFAAVEMQIAMEEIKQWNKKHKYPIFEMGIGMTSGSAYVGYIGSERRMEYDAIGSTINLVSRIEGYSTGGQLLISKACKDLITKPLIIADSFEITPKGYEKVIEVFSISGIDEPYNLKLPATVEVPIALEKPITVTFNVIHGKQISDNVHDGLITAASATSAILVTDVPLRLFNDIRLNMNGNTVGKVVSKSAKGFLVRYTSAKREHIDATLSAEKEGSLNE